MSTTNSRRMYTPQFSDTASISVRRFAWSINKSMPAAVDIMVKLLPLTINPSKVCMSCQDKSKCSTCIFKKKVDPEELTILETVL